MAFGVTAQGFIKKTLNDIQGETTQSYEDEFGAEFDITPTTLEGQRKGINDSQIAEVWDALEDVYNSQFPNTSEGVNLDQAVTLTGHRRRGKTFSRIIDGVGFGVISSPIPLGTIISLQGDPSIRFVTDEASTISIASVDEIQTIAFSGTPTSGKFNLDFGGNTTIDIDFTDNAAAVESALEGLASIGVGNVSVSGTFATDFVVTFQGTLGAQDVALLTFSGNTLDDGAPVTITITETTPGSLPKSPPIPMIADEEGPKAAPAGKLTVIETAVAGMTAFTNLTDALVGRDEETDPVLLQRREEEINTSGSGTVNAIFSRLGDLDGVTQKRVFANFTDVVDGDGIPPHSVRAVVLGGADSEIAETLLDSVCAGIRTDGAITEIVVDDQGFDQTIKFSRPSTKDIFVLVTLVTDSDFPANGNTLVQAAIKAYGDALGIGKDVVVFGSAPNLSCSFDDIPGITDFTLFVGTAPAPTLDDNIPVGAAEISNWLLANIGVS